MDLFPKDQKGGLAWPDDCYYLAGEEELPFLPSGCSSPDWASLGMGVPEAQREAGTMFSEADVSGGTQPMPSLVPSSLLRSLRGPEL